MNRDAVETEPTRWRADSDGHQRLVGSRCLACAAIVFPARASCAKCTSVDVSEHLLARCGRLWTWTMQDFAPKSPPFAGDVGDFVPFPVGYVELPGEAIVEARLVDVDPDRIAIGDEMLLVIWPFERADGTSIKTYGFTGVAR